ncbi:TPA: hypothetical protein RQK66_004273 [Vibrio vulnificus]|nr:hypothetical protein [Vibrio vulnificus]
MDIPRGFSFQWDSGGNGEHTWFVLAHEKDSKFVVANVSSVEGKRFIENTCILKPATCNYSKIVKESFVKYREAKVLDREELENVLSNNPSAVNSQAPCWLVDKMAAGLMMANTTGQWVKNHYRAIYSPIPSSDQK